MIIGPTPLCLKCARFHDTNEETFTCDAFPKGVPDEIVLGGFNHNNAFPGDNGMQFIPRVKFAVVAGEERDLSPFAAEVLGRIVMGRADGGFTARMRTLITEVDHAVSGLSPKDRRTIWKAFYTIVDELRSDRKRV
jgi:hypothetical protein